MWLPGTRGVKERRRRANQQRRIGRMRKDEEIQQKPTTRYQAGKQGVNQAASPGLEAKMEGEVGQIWRSLHRMNMAQTVDPEKSAPNPGKKGMLQPAGRWSDQVPPAHSSWVMMLQGDRLCWQGEQCLDQGALGFSSAFLWALNSGCIPSLTTQLSALSCRIIIDPLDKGWELTTVLSCLVGKEMTIAVAG